MPGRPRATAWHHRQGGGVRERSQPAVVRAAAAAAALERGSWHPAVGLRRRPPAMSTLRWRQAAAASEPPAGHLEAESQRRRVAASGAPSCVGPGTPSRVCPALSHNSPLFSIDGQGGSRWVCLALRRPRPTTAAAGDRPLHARLSSPRQDRRTDRQSAAPTKNIPIPLLGEGARRGGGGPIRNAPSQMTVIRAVDPRHRHPPQPLTAGPVGMPLHPFRTPPHRHTAPTPAPHLRGSWTRAARPARRPVPAGTTPTGRRVVVPTMAPAPALGTAPIDCRRLRGRAAQGGKVKNFPPGRSRSGDWGEARRRRGDSRTDGGTRGRERRAGR